MYVISPFHPSFVDTSTQTIQKECGIQCSLYSVSLPFVKTWMEGTSDILHLTKIPVFGCCLFFTTVQTKLDGVCAKMQIISHSFILILKYIQIQINSQF